MLTPEEIAEIDAEIATVPNLRAACIGALHAVQRRRGWVSDDVLCAVAAHLRMSRAELDNVATFYNLIYRRPVGRHVIRICNSVTCWMMGSDALTREVERVCGAGLGKTSSDGRFTVLPNPCLGCCDRAPALMVGESLYRDVAGVEQVLGRYR